MKKKIEMARSPYVVGIDADTKGIALYVMAVHLGGSGRLNLCTPQYIKRPKDADAPARHVEYVQQLQDAFRAIAALDAEIWVEDVFCRSRTGYRSLCMVHGELRLAALPLGCRAFCRVLASAWQPRVFKRVLDLEKRTIGGQTKVMSKQAALCIAGARMRTANEHECDACCIAYYARMRTLGCFA